MNWRNSISRLKTLAGIIHGGRAFGGPYQASISVTNRCNLNCIHCYFHSPLIERPNLMKLRRARHTYQEPPSDKELMDLLNLEADPSRLMSLIDELIGLDTTRFLLSGSGEPFLHKNILDFYARVKHANCTCIINTAGHMLNRENIDFLIKIGFDELRITTMAGSPKVYVDTHPSMKESTFKDIEENLLYIAQRKKELEVSRPKVILYSVVISQNHTSLLEFAEFASSVSADKVVYHPVDDVEDPKLSKIVPNIEESSKVIQQLVEVKSYLQARGITHNIDNFLKGFNSQLDTSLLYETIPCYYGWLSVRVDVDGNVYPCCRCYRSFGNIYKQPFQEIWYGDPYIKFRKEASKITRQEKPMSDCDCYSCPHYNANIRLYRMLHPISGLKINLNSIYQRFREERNS